MTRMRYKLLLLDLDMTLLDFEAGEKQALTESLALYGYQANAADLKLYHDINQGYWRRFERGEIKKAVIQAERFHQFVQELGLTIDPDELAETYMEHICQQVQPIAGAQELLPWLKGEGYQLAIVTNGTARNQESRLKLSGFLPYLDQVFISDLIGSPKPDPAFFSYVLDHVEPVEKDRILVVGDSLSSDILGGIRSGLDTCWIDWQGVGTDLPATYIIHSLDELPQVLNGGRIESPKQED